MEEVLGARLVSAVRVQDEQGGSNQHAATYNLSLDLKSAGIPVGMYDPGVVRSLFLSCPI